MDHLTIPNPRCKLIPGLGKLAEQLSTKATIMTRILSVFKFLKRVGFAVLLQSYDIVLQK